MSKGVKDFRKAFEDDFFIDIEKEIKNILEILFLLEQ
jgi:hypothetical protein